MAVFRYRANELYQWLSEGQDIQVVDVRNAKDFARFHIEAPRSFPLVNVPYFDFMEEETASVARVPRERPVRIVCAQEGSAKYVAEILDRHGFSDVGYLEGGIKSWGNLLVPQTLLIGEDWSLHQFIRPGKASCSYALLAGTEMIVFDPSRAVDVYLDFAEQHGCVLSATCETHLQADYIAGSRILASRTGARFYGHQDDFAGTKIEFVPLSDGMEIGPAAGPSVRALHTPGHTPGSISFIIDDRYFLSGDTVFLDSIGRPDLGGKMEEWVKLLHATMLRVANELSEDLIVLPAHFISWAEADEELRFARRLGQVKRANRHIFNLTDEAAFSDFIRANMRPQPPEYATIRMVNANLRQEDDDQLEVLDLGKNECAATAYANRQAHTRNAG